nr:MAG TPA: Integrase [Caudoviricetes sp.]
MAAIIQTPAGTYSVRWREEGKHRAKTFKTKSEARTFLRLLEDEGLSAASSLTFSEAVDIYEKDVTPTKRTQRQELFRLNNLRKLEFANRLLRDIHPADIEQYVNRRKITPSLKTGGMISDSTIIKDVNLISSVFRHAIKLGLAKDNPCKDIGNMPREPEHRERVASDRELEMIKQASGWDGKSIPRNSTQTVAAAFIFACRTGMRLGEIIQLEEAWIDDRVIRLPKEATKTEAARDVAMPTEALIILNLVRAKGNAPRIFGLAPETASAIWRKIRNRAGLGPVTDSEGRLIKEGLNFHDSRATFATWAASPNPKTGAPRLDVLALARQTGHKNLAMLQRYYRPSAEDIAKRLDE